MLEHDAYRCTDESMQAIFAHNYKHVNVISLSRFLGSKFLCLVCRYRDRIEAMAREAEVMKALAALNGRIASSGGASSGGAELTRMDEEVLTPPEENDNDMEDSDSTHSEYDSDAEQEYYEREMRNENDINVSMYDDGMDEHEDLADDTAARSGLPNPQEDTTISQLEWHDQWRERFTQEIAPLVAGGPPPGVPDAPHAVLPVVPDAVPPFKGPPAAPPQALQVTPPFRLHEGVLDGCTPKSCNPTGPLPLPPGPPPNPKRQGVVIVPPRWGVEYRFPDGTTWVGMHPPPPSMLTSPTPEARRLQTYVPPEALPGHMAPPPAPPPAAPPGHMAEARRPPPACPPAKRLSTSTRIPTPRGGQHREYHSARARAMAENRLKRFDEMNARPTKVAFTERL